MNDGNRCSSVYIWGSAARRKKREEDPDGEDDQSVGEALEEERRE